MLVSQVPRRLQSAAARVANPHDPQCPVLLPPLGCLQGGYRAKKPIPLLTREKVSKSQPPSRPFPSRRLAETEENRVMFMPSWILTAVGLCYTISPAQTFLGSQFVLDNSDQCFCKALNAQEELSMYLVSIWLKDFYVSLLLSTGKPNLIKKQKNVYMQSVWDLSWEIWLFGYFLKYFSEKIKNIPPPHASQFHKGTKVFGWLQNSSRKAFLLSGNFKGS